MIEDKELLDYGWAPGKYIFKCYDKMHIGNQENFLDRPMGDKYSYRCKECAIKAKENFQDRVKPWLVECFGEMIAGDKEERNHRFLEEALELVQSCNCTRKESHQLVDYVYDRPVGEQYQEVGGVMITLAALCLANNLDMHSCGEIELERIWNKIEKIREKQKQKPKHSPLPSGDLT